MNETIDVISLSDVISTICVVVVAWCGVIWLDRNVFNKGRYRNRRKGDWDNG